jgi:hypothetical protein
MRVIYDVGQTKMKNLYREEARRAQRWFTLKGDRIEIDGRDRGRKFSREFRCSDLSASTQHFVALRHDMMWRCLSLLTAAIFLAAIVSRIEFPFGMIALGLCLMFAAKFAWMSFGWAWRKEEVEIFHDSTGGEAFVIFNDKPGDSEFAEFVRQIKLSIENAAKKEAQPNGTDKSGAAPLGV